MTSRKPGKTSTNPPEISSREKALLLARLALMKKARGMTILNIGPLTTIAEYFIICSGGSVRQTRSICQQVQTGAKSDGILPLGVEGEEEGTWILLDYDDIVVHVFHDPVRELFSLEKLWSDAPRLIDPELEKEQAAVEHGQEEDEDWEP